MSAVDNNADASADAATAAAAAGEVPIIFALHNEGPGALAQLLAELADHSINLRLINTRRAKCPSAHGSQFEFLIIVSAEDAERVRSVIGDLCRHIDVLPGGGLPAVAAVSVPWFPRSLGDMDASSRQVFTYGVELNADHPGFSDETYRARRLVNESDTSADECVSEMIICNANDGTERPSPS